MNELFRKRKSTTPKTENFSQTPYAIEARSRVVDLNMLHQRGLFAGGAALQGAITRANNELELSRHNELSLNAFVQAYQSIFEDLSNSERERRTESDFKAAEETIRLLIVNNPDQFLRYQAAWMEEQAYTA